MQKKLPPLLFLAMISLVLVLGAPTAAAQGKELERVNARAQERMTRKAEVMSTLSEAKQRSCEARQDGVTKRMSQLVQLSANMLRVFESHSSRVQNYYLTKVVPAGIVVSNYDALLSDIAAKKAVVQTALANAQADVNDFSCTTGDPKSNLTSFRVNMQEVKSALKNFRTSVKNLVVAVSQAAEGLPEDEDENESPKPSASPSVSPSPTVSPSPVVSPSPET